MFEGIRSWSSPNGCSSPRPARCSPPRRRGREDRTPGRRRPPPRALHRVARATQRPVQPADRTEQQRQEEPRHRHRTEEGIAILFRLIEQADVFLTNFRSSTLTRYGLDVDGVRTRNPRVIYARGHGFGARGPHADRPGYDASAFWARGVSGKR